MKCQNLFSRKKKETISICRLFEILHFTKSALYVYLQGIVTSLNALVYGEYTVTRPI